MSLPHHERPIQPGDLVKIIGIPDLSSLEAHDQEFTLAVFRHLQGQRKRVRSLNDYGMAEICFAVRKGPLKGRHWVAIECHLLRRQMKKCSSR